MTSTEKLMVILGAAMVFSVACHGPIRTAPSEVAASADHELVLAGKLVLPFPHSFNDVWLDGSLVVITTPAPHIGYRSFYKNEIEFIGSSKTPYFFFTGAFSRTPDELESKFLEGLGPIKSQSHQARGELQFVRLRLKDRESLYLLSPHLEFVVEISVTEDTNGYISNVMDRARLR